MSIFPDDPYGIIGFGLWNEVFNHDNPNSTVSKYKREVEEADRKTYKKSNDFNNEEQNECYDECIDVERYKELMAGTSKNYDFSLDDVPVKNGYYKIWSESKK